MFLFVFAFAIGFGIAILKEQDRKMKNMIRMAEGMLERDRLAYNKKREEREERFARLKKYTEFE